MLNKTKLLVYNLSNLMPAVLLQKYNGPQTEPCCTPSTKELYIIPEEYFIVYFSVMFNVQLKFLC